MNRIVPSLIAAVLTGLVLLPFTGLLLTSVPTNIIAVAANCIMSIGVALFRPIRPAVYGVALAIALTLIPFAMIAVYGASNLSGLVVIISAISGLLAGGSAAIVGSSLRTLRLPRWTSAGTVAAAVMTLVATLGWSRQQQLDHHLQILDAIEKIRRAELAYAAVQPGHVFTCNGPDLPGFQTADWRTDPQMEEVGVKYRSQTHIAGRLVYLRCDPSPNRRWVDITAKNLYSGYVEATGRVER